jgi:hypothetical protein
MMTLVTNGVRYEQLGDLPVYRLDQLDECPGLVHAIFTRQGGVSRAPFATLNLGHTVGDDPAAVETNHHRVFQALNVQPDQVVTCHLTHSTDVIVVTGRNGGGLSGKGDALVTAHVGVYLSMRFADCLPLLLRDPVRGAVGLAHAGWRGTVRNVAGAVVQTMVDHLGCRAQNITAVIGPGIGPCCYRVGSEVIQAVEAAFDDGEPLLSRRSGHQAYFDLWQANRRQLLAAGVGRVLVMGICTACHPQHFFSHRAEHGRTGRFGVVIGHRE